MKYIIMFFCIIFCAVGDAALWVVGKMTQLVHYGTEKVQELERSEPHGAHEKSHLLLADGGRNCCMDGASVGCSAPTGEFYDWAMEAGYET